MQASFTTCAGGGIPSPPALLPRAHAQRGKVISSVVVVGSDEHLSRPFFCRRVWYETITLLHLLYSHQKGLASLVQIHNALIASCLCTEHVAMDIKVR